jgi:hypothetical protein
MYDAGNLRGSGAADLTGGGAAGGADAEGEALRTLTFAGVVVARGVGVEKEPSMPRARLAFVHLQCPLCRPQPAQRTG